MKVDLQKLRPASAPASAPEPLHTPEPAAAGAPIVGLKGRDTALWQRAAQAAGYLGELPGGGQFLRGSVIWSSGFNVVVPLEPGGGPYLKLVHAGNLEAAVKAVEGQEVELHGHIDKDTFRVDSLVDLDAVPLPSQPAQWPTKLEGVAEGCAVDAQFSWDPGMPGVPGAGEFGLGSLRLLVPMDPKDVQLRAALIMDADGNLRRISRYLTVETHAGEMRFFSASLSEACKRVRLGHRLRVGVVFDYQGQTYALQSNVVGVDRF